MSGEASITAQASTLIQEINTNMRRFEPALTSMREYMNTEGMKQIQEEIEKINSLIRQIKGKMSNAIKIEQELKDKEAELVELRKRGEISKEDLQKLNETIDELKEDLLKKTEQLGQLDAEKNRLAEEAAQSARLAASQVQEKDRYIDQMREETDKEIERLKRQIQEDNEKISAGEQEFSNILDQLRQLSQAVQERAVDVEKLKGEQTQYVNQIMTGLKAIEGEVNEVLNMNVPLPPPAPGSGDGTMVIPQTVSGSSSASSSDGSGEYLSSNDSDYIPSSTEGSERGSVESEDFSYDDAYGTPRGSFSESMDDLNYSGDEESSERESDESIQRRHSQSRRGAIMGDTDREYQGPTGAPVVSRRNVAEPSGKRVVEEDDDDKGKDVWEQSLKGTGSEYFGGKRKSRRHVKSHHKMTKKGKGHKKPKKSSRHKSTKKGGYVASYTCMKGHSSTSSKSTKSTKSARSTKPAKKSKKGGRR